jgi:hypothetical protein
MMRGIAGSECLMADLDCAADLTLAWQSDEYGQEINQEEA